MYILGPSSAIIMPILVYNLAFKWSTLKDQELSTAWTWGLVYWYGPVLRTRNAKTMKDIMWLNMNKTECIQLSLYGLFTILAWLLFANLNEDGGASISPGVEMLVNASWYVFILLFISLLFDLFVTPHLCPSSIASDDNNSTALSHTSSTTSTASISNQPFNMQSITSPSLGI